MGEVKFEIQDNKPHKNSEIIQKKKKLIVNKKQK
jgi:hypothetical protein